MRHDIRMILPAHAFGLTNRDLETLRSIFNRYPEIENVVLFGSRAQGNYKSGSDIDLAVMDVDIEDTTLRRINSDLEETSLPYRVDLIHYHTVTHPDLKKHIDRVGVAFYKKNEEGSSS